MSILADSSSIPPSTTFAEHGLTDLSLRRLASELGTSHRMLSHHFGSRDGLWLAIVQEATSFTGAVAPLTPPVTSSVGEPAAVVNSAASAGESPEMLG